MAEKPKVETVEEFVARGGVIKRYPCGMGKDGMVVVEEDRTVRSTAKHPPNLMDLDEGAHFFSEIKPKRKRKIKPDAMKDIDLSKIPEDIRKLLNLG